MNTNLDHAPAAGRVLPALDAEREARLTWALIAEPSDPIAQFVRAGLGVVDALAAARTARPLDLVRALGTRLPGDPTERRGATPEERYARALARWRTRLRRCDLDAARAAGREHGLSLVFPGDEQWPLRVEDLGAPEPVCLWAWGGADIQETFRRPALALVGARASTPYGEDAAAAIAAGVVRKGHCVLSGGAYGIDAASHRGALAAAAGRAESTAPRQGRAAPTVAILAGGLDSLYPRGNAALLERIGEQGLLLSEAPPGTAPTRWRFLARNRLIAALAGAVVVVEAGWRSGALNTARWADDLSRPIGAVPGPVTSAASSGCHRLSRERGAVLITDAEDAVELLPGGEPAAERAVQDELDLLSPADRRVLDAVPPRSARELERIADDIGFALAETEAAAGRLELLGLIRLDAGRARRAPQRR